MNAKKKNSAWAKCAPELSTNDEGVACYQGGALCVILCVTLIYESILNLYIVANNGLYELSFGVARLSMLVSCFLHHLCFLIYLYFSCA